MGFEHEAQALAGDQIGDLVGQDAHQAQAGQRGVDGGVAAVDDQTGVDGDAPLASALVEEGPAVGGRAGAGEGDAVEPGEGGGIARDVPRRRRYAGLAQTTQRT